MCGTGELFCKMLSQREKLTLFELYLNSGMQPSEIDLDIIDIDRQYLEDRLGHSLCQNKWQILIPVFGVEKCPLSRKLIFKTSSGRVDPCGVTAENTSTPVEIASREVDPLDLVERAEVLSILGEFTEIPDSLKFELVSKLNYWNDEEETKKQFRKLLSSLPLQLVRAKI